MQLRSLAPHGAGSPSIPLTSRLGIVTGLGHGEVERVLDALSSIEEGEVGEIRGEVSVGGVLCAFEPGAWRKPVILRVDDELADRDFAWARERFAAALTSYDAIAQLRSLNDAEYRGACEALIAARADLEATRVALDPSALAAHDVARREMAELEDLATALEESDETVLSDLRARHDELTTRIDTKSASLDALDVPDASGLAEAAEQLRGSLHAEPTDPTATVLLERWRALDAELEQVRTVHDGSGGDYARSTARLEAARDRLREVRVASEPQSLRPDDVAALERAHDRVQRLERRIGRFHAGRAKRQLDAALAEERELLDRYGFPTWSAYILGSTLFGSDPDAAVILADAENRLRIAEHEWHVARAGLAANPAAAAVLEQLEGLHREIVAYVGRPVGDDTMAVEEALAAVGHDDVGDELDVEEASAAVREALTSVDVDVDTAASADELLELADATVLAQRELEVTRRRIEAEVGELRAERDALADALSVTEPNRAEPTPDGVDLSDRRMMAAARVHAAAERLSAHGEALDRVTVLLDRVETISRQQRRLGDRVNEIERDVERALGEVLAAAQEVFAAGIDEQGPALDELALPLLAAARCDEPDGGAPIVVHIDATRSDVASRFVELSRVLVEICQVVVLSDEPTLIVTALSLDEPRCEIVPYPSTSALDPPPSI